MDIEKMNFADVEKRAVAAMTPAEVENLKTQKPKPTKSKYLEMKRLQFQGWIDDS